MTEAAFWLCLRPEAGSGSLAERIVEEARAACAVDTAERAREAGFEAVVVHTSAPELFTDCPAAQIALTDPAASIGSVIAAAAASAAGPVCYAGAGLPAMSVADWSALRERIEAGETVTNNLHSADCLGVPQAASLTLLAGEATDNSFARRLREEADITISELERSAPTLLDLDTPADLALLSLGCETSVLAPGPRAAAALGRWRAPLAPARDRLASALDLLTERSAQLMVIGRIGSAVWAALDRSTAARVRVISEERGLRRHAAQGGAVRSLLGLHGEAVGASALIDGLAELADGVVFDTRPLFAHLGWGRSRADRFAADLGDPSAITARPLREFVDAVIAAPAPIALGGHSLVAGGLLAGIDIAWTRREQAEIDRLSGAP